MPAFYFPCYTFDFKTNGFEIKFDRDNTVTRQFFPFREILSVRLDFNGDDKIHSLTLLLHESLKYAYPFKSQQEAERIYEQVRDALQ